VNSGRKELQQVQQEAVKSGRTEAIECNDRRRRRRREKTDTSINNNNTYYQRVD
jgi:hypothetical protein